LSVFIPSFSCYYSVSCISFSRSLLRCLFMTFFYLRSIFVRLFFSLPYFSPLSYSLISFLAFILSSSLCVFLFLTRTLVLAFYWYLSLLSYCRFLFLVLRFLFLISDLHSLVPCCTASFVSVSFTYFWRLSFSPYFASLTSTLYLFLDVFHYLLILLFLLSPFSYFLTSFFSLYFAFFTFSLSSSSPAFLQTPAGNMADSQPGDRNGKRHAQ
jgi:hypothetical protein